MSGLSQVTSGVEFNWPLRTAKQFHLVLLFGRMNQREALVPMDGKAGVRFWQSESMAHLSCAEMDSYASSLHRETLPAAETKRRS